jgi:opacity protein-like surface antigen
MINLKKAALAVIALGISSVVCAGMYEPPPSMMVDTPTSKHGPYVGIGLGGIGFQNEVTSQGSVTLNGLEARNVSSSADGGTVALNSFLLAGYAWTFPNKVFLGGEIFGNLTNAPVTLNSTSSGIDAITGANTSGNANVDMTLQGAYGVRALPGYQVTPSSVVYGIVGYSRAYTETSTTNNLATDLDGTSVGYNLGSSNHYWFNGLQLGLGSMISVTDNIALRGDLIWTGYQEKTLDSNSSTNAVGSAQGSVSAQPTTLEANVGLVYTFDA